MIELAPLLQNYNQSGPRYTSYPTVPLWTNSVDSIDYERALRQIQPGEPLSFYFHMPFCTQLCHFCGCFQMITRDRSKSAGYTELLLKELQHLESVLLDGDHPVTQVHFGGGTPNFFRSEEIATLMNHLRGQFRLDETAEVAMELHPRTYTEEFGEMLAQQGFNRLSVGVQSFDDRVQALIHRFQSYEMTANMVSHLRGLGLNELNFDLVYGLPGQTAETFAKTLEKTIELRPNRLALYSYAHVPWKRPVQRSFSEDDLPQERERLHLFSMAYERFLQDDYVPIGMDHFALKTDSLSEALKKRELHRNFMGYSTQPDAHQVGLGISSISFVAGSYFQNTKDLKRYQGCCESGHFSTERGYLCSLEDDLRRRLINELMCHQEVDKKRFGDRFGIDFESHFSPELERLRSFCDEGLLEIDERWIRVKGYGHLVLRNMAMCFDEHLPGFLEKVEEPVFSKTL